jgi:hypothetical protein
MAALRPSAKHRQAVMLIAVFSFTMSGEMQARREIGACD